MNSEASVNGATTTSTTNREAPVWYRPAVDVFEGPEGFRLVMDVPAMRRRAGMADR